MQALHVRTSSHVVCGRGRRLARPVPCKTRVLRLPVRPAVARSVAGTSNDLRASPAQEKPKLTESLTQKLQTVVKNSVKSATIFGLALALVLGRCDAAQAARSAGRAGGFHSSPPASRSYSGGGGGMRGGGMRGGYSGGVYSSPYSSPFSSYRAPMVVPSPPIIVPGPPVVYSTPGVVVGSGATMVRSGPDLFDLAVVAIFLTVAASAATGMMRGAGEGGLSLTGGAKPTLTRVQVGLVSLARELKADLDRIAARADTSSSRGLHYLLQEVVLALLRNPSYCIYGATSQHTAGSVSSLETAFNKASMKERAKFEEETLVNVAGAAARRGSFRPRGSSKPDELIVVTLLVATKGDVDIPAKIDSLASLREALQALGGLSQDEVVGVEVLWTPQAEGDYYTKDELIADYPNLRQL